MCRTLKSEKTLKALLCVGSLSLGAREGSFWVECIGYAFILLKQSNLDFYKECGKTVLGRKF